VHVIDGGYFLHHLTCGQGGTYNAIVQTYIDIAGQLFGRGIVIFGGFSGNPSIKDVAPIRRNK